MQKITYKQDLEIPVIADVEICVVGAGPGGLGAAVSAARQNRDVLLVERYGAPGGMAFWGEVHPFMANKLHGQMLDVPLQPEWMIAMNKYTRQQSSEENYTDSKIDKNAAMLAAEDMLLEAGAKLLYHHTLVDVIVEDKQIKYIIVHSKSGLAAIKAKVFIDSSGDGDVAALAGEEIEYGNEDNLCQPMTLCFKLSNVDVANMPPRAEINRLYDLAKQRGDVVNPREDVLYFDFIDDDVIHFNTTRIIKKSALSGVELSEAEIEGRKQLRMMFNFLRRDVKGFENSKIHTVAHHIGVRESRRVMGRSYLTEQDFINCSKFDDAIARGRYVIDIHNPSGSGTILKHMPEDEWYEIPYGAIVAKSFSNLLIASRSISVDHAMHSSMRVMPIVLSIGQGAGIAAAIAIEKNIAPENLDGREVRKRLAEFGASV